MAAVLLQLSCEEGNAEACGLLGRHSSRESVFPPTIEPPWAISSELAALGFAPSCLGVASIYVHGTESIAPDPGKAVAVLDRGCELGDADCCAAVRSAAAVGD